MSDTVETPAGILWQLMVGTIIALALLLRPPNRHILTLLMAMAAAAAVLILLLP